MQKGTDSLKHQSISSDIDPVLVRNGNTIDFVRLKSVCTV